MDRIPEFMANHPILIAALLLLLGMIGGLEFSRLRRAAQPVSAARATRLANSEDAVFVDTRRRNEFEAGHVPNARNLPAAEVEQYIKQFEKLQEQPLVLYDDGGMAAHKTARQLAKRGFTRLYELDGGLQAWRDAKLPLEQGGKSKKKKAS